MREINKRVYFIDFLTGVKTFKRFVNNCIVKFKIHVSAGTFKRFFKIGWGDSSEFKQKDKFANFILGVGWEAYKRLYLLQLWFHCEFPDFNLRCFVCFLKGGGAPRYYSFRSVNKKKGMLREKVWGVPNPSPNPMLCACCCCFVLKVMNCKFIL